MKHSLFLTVIISTHSVLCLFFVCLFCYGVYFASCKSVTTKSDIYFKYSDDTAVLSILLGNSDSLLVYKQSSSDSSWSVNKFQVKSYK